MNRAIKSALALVLLLTSYTALWADAQLPPVPPASSSVAGKAKCDGTTTLCDTDGTMHATNGGSVGITQATGDVTTPASSSGSTVFTIGALKVITAYINDLAVTTAKIADGAITTAKHAANSATNAVLAQMAAHTFKGNNTGSTANALDLTTAQLTAELNAYTSLLQGVVPPSVTNNHSNILWDDGWGAAPAGGGGGGSVSVTASTPNTVVAPSPGTGTFTVGTTVPLHDISGSGVAIVTGDNTKIVKLGAFTYTLAQAGTTGFSSGWGACLLNVGAGNATINATTSVFVGAGASTTLVLAPNAWACPSSDGTNYQTPQAGNIVAGSNVTITRNADGTATIAATSGGGLTCDTGFTSTNGWGDCFWTQTPAASANNCKSNGNAVNCMAWTGLSRDRYRARCSNLNGNTTSDIGFQYHLLGDPAGTWKEAANSYTVAQSYNNGANGTTLNALGNTTVPNIRVIFDPASTPFTGAATVEFSDLTSASIVKLAEWKSVNPQGSNGGEIISGWAWFPTPTTAVDGIRIIDAQGTPVNLTGTCTLTQIGS